MSSRRLITLNSTTCPIVPLALESVHRLSGLLVGGGLEDLSRFWIPLVSGIRRAEPALAKPQWQAGTSSEFAVCYVFFCGKFYLPFFASFIFIRALTNFFMSTTGSFLFKGKRTVAVAVS
jgi:hypothetical protein